MVGCGKPFCAFFVAGCHCIKEFTVLQVPFLNHRSGDPPISHCQPKTLFTGECARLLQQPRQYRVVGGILNAVVEFAQQFKRGLHLLRCLRARLPNLFHETIRPIKQCTEFFN